MPETRNIQFICADDDTQTGKENCLQLTHVDNIYKRILIGKEKYFLLKCLHWIYNSSSMHKCNRSVTTLWIKY